MSIQVRCPSCSAAFAVKDELAGKKIRCVKCKEIMTVVAASSGGPSAAPTGSVQVPPKTNVSPPNAAASSPKPAAPPKPAPPPMPVAPQEQGLKQSKPAPKENIVEVLPENAAAPVVRKARRVAEPVSGEDIVTAEPVTPPAPASRAVVRARTVSGPRDVQQDAIRHTAATLSAPPEDFTVLRKKVLASFQAEAIEPVPVTGTYRLSIALVSLFMIVLPFVYLMIIGLVGWGVWYHTVNHTGIISAASGVGTGRNAGRAVVFAFMIYVTPIVAGATLVIFMFKPLFSRPAQDSGRRSLKRSDEPLLFEFVDRICDTVKAPRPSRIDIDCNINASASFGKGLLSFVGNDLVLTLGMPLVAGLTMRQFGGVLAHEFGHFAQGAGMRLSYVIRSISYWFTRVVYERDSWDEKLEELSHSLDIRIGWIVYLVRLGVWLTRRILWCLMMLGHLISGYLMRQMEFDADRYEARFAGSKTFATTARQLSVLGVAYRGAMSDIGTFYSEGRLGDNLPKLILLNVDQLPEKVHAKIDEMIMNAKTGLFDTHPSDPERMASAARENTEGVFTLRLPAAHLFQKFDFLSRAVTWDFYKEVIGDQLKKSDIHPVDELMERLKIQQAAWKALRRFFQGHLSWYRPFQSPAAARNPVKRPDEVIRHLKYSRESMLIQAQKYAEAWKTFDECDTVLIEIGLAEILIKAGLRVRKSDFSIPLTNRDEIRAAREATEIRQGRVAPKLAPFEDAAADRLYSGLQLARLPEYQATLQEQGATLAELDMLIDLFDQMNERIGQLLVIRDCQLALGKLLTMLSDNSENPKLIEQIKQRMSELHDHITNLRESFWAVPYPFDHAKADMTVGEYFLKELPDKENPVALYEAAASIGQSMPPLQGRVFGRLCQIAEMVETQIGLVPLEDPPEEEPDLEENEDDE
ncbi:MAG: M48 family metalloprotease [Planctomycetaceae bacterium]